MLCDKCNKNNAAVYIKKGINGVYREYNLCEQCAAEEIPSNKYVDYINPFAFLIDGGIFSNLLESKYTQRRAGEESKQTFSCKTCGSTLNEIYKTGKFGCGDCYSAFYNEALPGIAKIHSNKEYTGRIPKRFKARLSLKEKTEALRNELSAAIERQDFEKAAELRDKIKDLNGMKERGE